MIQITNTPAPCVLSKNPISFQLFASNYSAERNVFPYIHLNLTNKLDANKFFQFSFKNPNTKSKETITFVTSTSPKNDGSEVPSLPFPGTHEQYVSAVADYMKKNAQLISYYNVEANNDVIEIVAKEGIEELIPIDFSQNIANTNSIFETIFSGFWKAKKRQGHRVNINIYFEKEYMSNVFELVSSQNDTVDNYGFQDIEINSILDSEIKNSFETPPLPEPTNPIATNVIQKANVLRRYYIEVAEEWSKMKSPITWVKSNIMHVHFGGVSMEDFTRGNPLDYVSSEKMALTWWRNKKRVYPEQKDWMSAMNISSVNDEYSAELNILYKDGSIDIFNIGSVDVKPWETITIPVGYKQLNIEVKQDVAKEVYGWEVKVKNLNNEVVCSRTYLLHQPQNFKTNTIVYLNSFGVAESFICSGFFENSLLTTADIASKTLKHDYKSINGRDFVFNKNSKNTFKARTGILNKQESKALQSMLNVAPVFLVEKNLLRPIIIDPASFVIDQESEITQTIDFKITKSLELTNVSEMITKPTLIIEENCGMFTINVQSDEPISNYGVLKILYTGNVFEITTYNAGKYAVATKAEDNGVYIFQCEVTIGSEVIRLEASYDFKRDEVYFLSPNHIGLSNFTSFEIKSAVDEKIRVYTQSTIDTEFSLTADTLHAISIPVFNGVKKHIISSSCLNNILEFRIKDQAYSNFHLEKMINLEVLFILNCSLTGHFSTGNLRNLFYLELANNDITSFEIGMNLDLMMLNLIDNNLNAVEIENVMKEAYEYRKLFTKKHYPDVILSFIGNPGAANLSQNAINMKDGLAEYSGDGLIQNNILIYI